MIPTLAYGDGVAAYELRGIGSRDMFALDESMDDWPEIDGRYDISCAMRDVERWGYENKVFAGLPAADFAPLTWTLDRDSVPVGFVRIVFLGTQGHIHFQVIHPDFRGQGLFTTMNLMLRTLIVPLGVERVTFESLETAPQVATHATKRLELAPIDSRVGLTGLVVDSYEFTAADHVARLLDPVHSAEAIPTVLAAVPVAGTETDATGII
jgi:hypothetical protein